MMDYQNLLWSQWRMALLQLTIYRRMFWTDYLIVLATNLCRMLTIETTMMFANLATKYSGSIFDGYSDVSDDECDGVNAEDELRTVLSMLDDAVLFLVEKRYCEFINMQSLIGIGPVAMNVLANIQMNTSVI